MSYFGESQRRKTMPTPEEQQELFELWWESKQPYRDAVVAGGGPIRDKQEASELFFRRWKRPEPPEGLKLKTLSEIHEVN